MVVAGRMMDEEGRAIASGSPDLRVFSLCCVEFCPGPDRSAARPPAARRLGQKLGRGGTVLKRSENWCREKGGGPQLREVERQVDPGVYGHRSWA